MNKILSLSLFTEVRGVIYDLHISTKDSCYDQDFNGKTYHYENTPIQIYCKFYR